MKTGLGSKTSTKPRQRNKCLLHKTKQLYFFHHANLQGRVYIIKGLKYFLLINSLSSLFFVFFVQSKKGGKNIQFLPTKCLDSPTIIVSYTCSIEILQKVISYSICVCKPSTQNMQVIHEYNEYILKVTILTFRVLYSCKIRQSHLTPQLQMLR